MLTLKKERGFTLIELLVVIAIIGVLAAVVLASVNSARLKGAEASVKSNLHTVINQAELFYSNNGNSYLPAGGTAIGITAPCPVYAAGGTNLFSNNKLLADALAQAVASGMGGAVGSSCYNSSSAWAAAVQLKTSDGAGAVTPLPDSWCVDSSGTSKSYTWTLGETILSSINVSVCK